MKRRTPVSGAKKVGANLASAEHFLAGTLGFVPTIFFLAIYVPSRLETGAEAP